MTSFIANTFALIAHKPETVSAIFATSREIMNSSVCPVTLSNDEVWDLLCSRPFGDDKENKLLKLFYTFSSTMQFTEKLRFHHPYYDFLENIITGLIENTRYFCRTLQHLDCPSSKMISIAGKHLRNIKSIGLSLMNDSEAFGSKDLEMICDSFPFIRKLDLSSKSAIENDGVQHLSKLKLLEELKFSNIEALTGLDCIHYPFLRELKSLKKLDVSWNASIISYDCLRLWVDDEGDYQDNNNNNNNNNNDEQKVALPSLLELNVRECYLVDLTVMNDFRDHAPNLTSLTCSSIGLNIFQGDPFRYPVTGMRNLRILDCYGDNATPASIQLLSENLQYLQDLRIQKATGLTNTCLKHISKLPLRILELSGSRVGTLNFSDEGFLYLTGLDDLEALTISFNENLTGDLGEDQFFSPTLNELRLPFCRNVSEGGLTSILKNLSLTALEVKCFNHLTHEGLGKALNASNSKETLHTLSVAGCRQINTFSFLEGLVSLKHLNIEDLYIDNCYNHEEEEEEEEEEDNSEEKEQKEEEQETEEEEEEDCCNQTPLWSNFKTLKVTETGDVAGCNSWILFELPETVLTNLQTLETCFPYEQLSTDALMVGIANMPSLKVLELFFCGGHLKTNDLEKLVRRLPCLQKMKVSKETLEELEFDPRKEIWRVICSCYDE